MTGRQLPMASATTPAAPKRRLPEWFRTSLPSGAQQAVFNSTKAAVKDNQLHTVCEEARCPNIHECWASGDATFMIAGQECTRVSVLRRWHHQTPASSRPWRTRAPRSSGVLDEPPARGHHRREPRRPRRQWSRPLQTLHRCSGTNQPERHARVALLRPRRRSGSPCSPLGREPARRVRSQRGMRAAPRCDRSRRKGIVWTIVVHPPGGKATASRHHHKIVADGGRW